MQLSQLEYLQAVANYGGVRKAARAVHVSPQAVSSAIKKLESEYQVVLLDRSTGEDRFVSCRASLRDARA